MNVHLYKIYFWYLIFRYGSVFLFSIFQSLIWMPYLSDIKIKKRLTAISKLFILLQWSVGLFHILYNCIWYSQFSLLHHMFISPDERIILQYSLFSVYISWMGILQSKILLGKKKIFVRVLIGIALDLNIKKGLEFV